MKHIISLMNNFRNITSILFSASLVVLLASCQDDNQPMEINAEEDVELAENSQLSEAYSEEDISFSYLAADISGETGGRVMNEFLPCATITRDAELKTVTIDFGESCIGPYGRERSGKILIAYGGEFNDQLANRVITFDNYVVNNRGVSGMIELRDINRNGDGNLPATRKMTDYTIEFPNGTTYVANGSITREWIEGEGDGDPRTNVIRLTGSREGISSRGRTHTVEITEPIIASFPCRTQGGFLRTAGRKQITISRESAERIRTVYYGDGTCDNEVSMTVNGRSFTLTGE